MSNAIDEELQSIAQAELADAFWHDFSGLVNKYLEAAEGLDVDLLEVQLQDLTSVYGRSLEEVNDDVFLNIYTVDADHVDCSHDTMLEALEREDAVSVFLRGKKIFKRVKGEWWVNHERNF